MQIDSPSILTQLNVSGSGTISGSLTVTGPVSSSEFQGTATSASYVEFEDIGNKPALVSGSSQVSFSGISDKPSLVSGSSQIELNQISGNEFISQSYAFPSNLTIRGNLVVSGSTFIEDTQTIQITDNLLVVNSGEQGEGVTSTIAGIQIDRGTATDFQFIFDENSKDFQVGEIGDLQSVATRQTTPTNAGIPFWNSSQNRFDNSGNATLGSNGNLQASSFTGSIDFSNLENSPTLVSGSSQITLSDTDGFTSYSGSVSSSLDEKVNITDIVNDLTTGGTTVPGSAENDKTLKELVDGKVPLASDAFIRSAGVRDLVASCTKTDSRSGQAFVDFTINYGFDKQTGNWMMTNLVFLNSSSSTGLEGPASGIFIGRIQGNNTWGDGGVAGGSNWGSNIGLTLISHSLTHATIRFSTTSSLGVQILTGTLIVTAPKRNFNVSITVS